MGSSDFDSGMTALQPRSGPGRQKFWVGDFGAGAGCVCMAVPVLPVWEGYSRPCSGRERLRPGRVGDFPVAGLVPTEKRRCASRLRMRGPFRLSMPGLGGDARGDAVGHNRLIRRGFSP